MRTTYVTSVVEVILRLEAYCETKIPIRSIPMQKVRGLKTKGLVRALVRRDRGGKGVS